MQPERSTRNRLRWPVFSLVAVLLLGGLYLLWRQLPAGPAEPLPAAPPLAAATKPGPGSAGADGTATPVSTIRATLRDSSEDSQWLQRLRRADLRARMQGLPVSSEVLQLLQQGRISQAAALLESRSASDDRDATVVLAGLAYQCEILRGTQADRTNDDLDRTLRDLRAIPSEQRRRIGAARATARDIDNEWREGCNAARLNTAAIDQRLRSAAAEGHEASLWWLGNLAVADPPAARKYWLSAAMLGHQQAQSTLGESYWVENLRGEHRDRGRMAFWLNAAARHSPAAQSMLGQCRLTGCDGQPSDPAAAAPLLLDSAKAGDRTAIQLLPTDPSQPPLESEYAWLSYQQKLNDRGCYGASQYPSIALQSSQRIERLNDALSPFALQQAQQLAEQRWREYSPIALQSLGCG